MASSPGKSFQYMLRSAISETNVEWIIVETSDYLIIPLFTGYEIDMSAMSNIIIFSFYTLTLSPSEPSLLLSIIGTSVSDSLDSFT